MATLINKLGQFDYEIKKNNRWVLTFPKSFNIESFCVKSTQRPTLTIIDGKITINPISINFIDLVGPSTSQKLYKVLKKYGINNKPFNYQLEILDPTGVVVEKWTIIGCEIVKIDFGSLDYSDDGIMECKMIIIPKNVKLHF